MAPLERKEKADNRRESSVSQAVMVTGRVAKKSKVMVDSARIDRPSRTHRRSAAAAECLVVACNNLSKAKSFIEDILRQLKHNKTEYEHGVDSSSQYVAFRHHHAPRRRRRRKSELK